jgi:hypothetical protein
LVAVGLALTVPSAFSAQGAGSEKSQTAAIQKIERTRLRALVSADTKTAQRLIAPNFHLINPAGDRLTRGDYLGAVGSGDIHYRVFKPIPPITVEIAGTIAALQYKARFDIVAGGLRLAHDGWVSVLYSRQHGQWRAYWEQATAIPNHPDSLINALKP